MPAAWIAAGSGLLGGLGGLFHKKQDPLKQYINPLYTQLFQSEKQFFGKAVANQNQALNTINAGYDTALGNIKGGGFSAKQSVLDNQQQVLGKVQQNAVNTGMYGSSVGANQTAQAGAMAGKNLAAIDTTLGQLMANLNVQKTGAVAGQQNNMANLAMQQAGMNAQLGEAWGGATGGYQYQNNTAGQLGYGLGGIASMFFGNGKSPFGGGSSGGYSGGFGGFDGDSQHGG